jgi:hypothetical protein
MQEPVRLVAFQYHWSGETHVQAVVATLGPVVFEIKVQLMQRFVITTLSAVLQTVQVLAVEFKIKPTVGQ